MNVSKPALFLSGLFFGGAVDHAILAGRGGGKTPYGYEIGVPGNWLMVAVSARSPGAAPARAECAGQRRGRRSQVRSTVLLGVGYARHGRRRQVFVFQYPTSEAAAADAAVVSPTGQPSPTASIMWVGKPHFHRQDRLIVLYVGCTADLPRILDSALGPPFVVGTGLCPA